MRIRETIVAAGFITTFSAAFLLPREAKAQTVRPFTTQSGTWNTVSNVTMVLGAGIVTLMPRVYYNDPEATVGWKGRWHISMLAPALSMTALTLLVDGPIRNAIKDPRPGCTADQTAPPGGGAPGSGCESYGMPSTQSFASWGATGAGTAIFIVDTFKYSNGKFHVGGFIGNVGVPLILSVVTSVGRSIAPSDGFNPSALESPLQIVAGSLSGFVTGALLGLGYSFLQRPNCGYGGYLVCW
jgi:hypothetical protein